MVSGLEMSKFCGEFWVGSCKLWGRLGVGMDRMMGLAMISLLQVFLMPSMDYADN